MKNINFYNRLSYVDAIMIVDRHGKIVYSVRYNPRFDSGDSEEECLDEILNKNFLEIYPKMKKEESTMMTCIEDGNPIYEEEQTFTDYGGRIVTTENLTIPIIRRGKILGAIELSKDITKVSENKRNTHNIRNKYNTKKVNFTFNSIITNNEIMKNNINRGKLVANSPSSILIYGETGTGKELYVQSIHGYSDRSDKKLVVQNCAALPENLFESILFGTVKGAFTGAMDKPGLFEEADGGTLFLDELNSMPLNLQAKLLRVLQNGKVRRVGSNEEQEVDVRVIAAMNKEPIEAIELEELREDLFYRLSVITLRLVPLRDRPEDIPLYIDYFIKEYSKLMGKEVISVTDEVKKIFLNYSWPGNVRELEHVIESSINFTDGPLIKVEHLPIYMSDVIEGRKEKEEIKLELEQPLDTQMSQIEKHLIKEALDKTAGNITKAADLLQITRQSLHYKIDKYGIN